MGSFSQRYGFAPVRSAIQVGALDEDTRRVLWNRLSTVQSALSTLSDQAPVRRVLLEVWTGVLGQFHDGYAGSTQSAWPLIKYWVLRREWFEVFDLLEALVAAVDREDESPGAGNSLVDALNSDFERQLVGYRFVSGQVVPIDSDSALQAVQKVLDGPHAVAKHHIDRALKLLADRESPDYPNSIKESISAVESAVRLATGATTLGAGVKKLDAAGIAIHPGLVRAWDAMYGWTSDESGIRHGGITAPEVNQALAKYMLVICSAFVSYLLEVDSG